MEELDFLDDLVNTGLEKIDDIEINTAINQNSKTAKLDYSKVEKKENQTSAQLPYIQQTSKTPTHIEYVHPHLVSPPMETSLTPNLQSNGDHKQLGIARNERFRLPKVSLLTKSDDLLRKKMNSKFGDCDAYYDLSENKTMYLKSNYIKDEDEYFEQIDFLNYDNDITEDPWSSTKLPKEQWKEIDYKQEDCIVNVNCVKEDGFHLEINKQSVTKKTLLKQYSIIDVDQEFNFLSYYFLRKETTRYYYDTVTSSLLIVDTSTKNQKAILKNKKDTFRILIPHTLVQNSKFLENELLFPSVGDEKAKPKLIPQKNIPKIENELTDLEMKSIVLKYKFGVIYVKEDQTEENQFFANDECCDEFWEFMDLIGNKIELQGWEGYRAGLDVKSNCTGTHSYFNKFLDRYNVMFHVAPLLPNQESDLQKLERKRHVGNDVVVIIFLDPKRTEPFDPRILTSHFNNIFFVIKPERRNEMDGYVLNIATKSDNLPFPPFMDFTWMKKGNEFANFLLKKLINSERMCMYNTTFIRNAQNTRKQQLSQLIGYAQE